MSDEAARNSEVIPAIRPEDLMEELGIKKSAYHEDLKFLSIKPQKDGNGKSFLEECEANQVRALRSWISEHGKRAGFLDSNSEAEESGGELATTDDGEIAAKFHPPEQEDPTSGFDEEALFLEAAELAGHRMTLGDRLVLSLSNQMTYDDLPDSVKSKVDGVRRSTVPKFQPEAIASQLLSKWRSEKTQHSEQSQQQEAVEAA